MLRYLKTAVDFTKNISETGAFSETSGYVVSEITKYIDSNRKQIIVEFGAGHGNITRGILAKMNPNSSLFAFEINKDFCKILDNINDSRLKVVSSSAEDINNIIKGESTVDCIISSIPFSFIPDIVLEEILKKSHSLLKDDHFMTQVLYSARHLRKYKKYFKNLSEEYHTELDKLTNKIYEMAGVEFNINSPKQLGEVLFGKMGMKTNYLLILLSYRYLFLVAIVFFLLLTVLVS